MRKPLGRNYLCQSLNFKKNKLGFFTSSFLYDLILCLQTNRKGRIVYTPTAYLFIITHKYNENRTL